MSWIFANDLNPPVTADHLALFTNCLDASSNLQLFPLISWDFPLEPAGSWTLLVSVGNSSSCEVVRSKFNLDPVAWKYADPVHPHLSRTVRKHLVSILKLDTEHSIRQGLDNGPFQNDHIFLGLGQLTLLKQNPITAGTLRYANSNFANSSLKIQRGIRLGPVYRSQLC